VFDGLGLCGNVCGVYCVYSSDEEPEKKDEGSGFNLSKAASSGAECRDRDDVWRVKVMLEHKVRTNVHAIYVKFSCDICTHIFIFTYMTMTRSRFS
jgi:hypothetical protein